MPRFVVQHHCNTFTQKHSLHEPDSSLETVFKVTVQSLTFVGRVWYRLVQEEKIYCYDKDSTHNSSMTMILDLKIWFKVTAHPFPIRHSVDEVWARLGQGERKYALGKWCGMERLIPIGRRKSWTLSNI